MLLWEYAVEDERLRAVNAAIGKNYDAIVYDPQPMPMLALDRVCGQAALFGEVRPPVDVLDIGCGTGAQLLQAAPAASGRIFGVDISEEACNRARAKLEPFGDRVTIESADLLELTPERLGTFDAVFNIGVVFVVPEPVRRKILDLVGQCLRPGGVAVISYYAGTVPTLRSNLHRMLRAATSGLQPGDAVRKARQWMEKLAGDFAETEGLDPLRAAIAQSKSLSDVMLFHEALNNASEAMQTSWLERELAAHGVKFASYLPSAGLDAPDSSQDRALAADVLDFAAGSYRYALFLKDDSMQPPNFRTEQVRWVSGLQRDNPGQLHGEHTFAEPGNPISLTVRSPANAAMLDVLAEAPRAWSEMIAEVQSRVVSAGHALGEDEIGSILADLYLVWKHGLAHPLFR